jgi:hypothetical protein
VSLSSHSTNRTPGKSRFKASSVAKIRLAWKPTSPPSVLGTPTTTSRTSCSLTSRRRKDGRSPLGTIWSGLASTPPGSEIATPVRTSPTSRAAMRPRSVSRRTYSLPARRWSRISRTLARASGMAPRLPPPAWAIVAPPPPPPPSTPDTSRTISPASTFSDTSG